MWVHNYLLNMVTYTELISCCIHNVSEIHNTLHNNKMFILILYLQFYMRTKFIPSVHY